jgi:hypothetical protein
MRKRAEAFDRWIRTSFVEMNTGLEQLYFAQRDRARVIGVGDGLKAQLRDEGRAHIVDLLQEGNTGDGFASAFGVLGNARRGFDRHGASLCDGTSHDTQHGGGRGAEELHLVAR